MNPNDFEKQQKLAIRNKARLEAKNKRKIEKERQKNERKQARFNSFETLAADNRDLGERGQAMISLSEKFDKPYHHKQSPWIVLRRGDESEYSWTLGLVERGVIPNNSRYNNYRFKVYVTDAESAARAMKEPTNTKINSPGPTEETSFFINEDNKEEDEIAELSGEIASGRKFSPIHALKRYSRRKSADNRLASLGETVAMFEQAVANNELNPHLQKEIPLLSEQSA